MNCACNDERCKSTIAVDTMGHTIYVERDEHAVLLYVDVPLIDALIKQLEECKEDLLKKPR